MSPIEKLEVNGTVKATSFSGDGSFLTGITVTDLGYGTISNENVSMNAAIDFDKLDITQSDIDSLKLNKLYDSSGNDVVLKTTSEGNVGVGTEFPMAELEVSGSVKATNFSGNGSGLTNISLSGAVSYYQQESTSSTLSSTYGDIVSQSVTVTGTRIAMVVASATLRETTSSSGQVSMQLVKGFTTLGKASFETESSDYAPDHSSLTVNWVGTVSGTETFKIQGKSTTGSAYVDNDYGGAYLSIIIF